MQAGERRSLREGIEAFNRGHFFEAHDHFEEAWRGTRGPDREFLGGLVHLAVGLYHLDAWNLEGARSQLARGLAALAPCGDCCHGVDLPPLRAGIAECVRRIPPGGENPDFAGLRRPLITIRDGGSE